MLNNYLALIRNIKVKCRFVTSAEIDNEAISKAISFYKRNCRISCDLDKAYIYKKSVDARNKSEIYFVYTVALPVNSDKLPVNTKGIDFILPFDSSELFESSLSYSVPPVVVGFGPAGMFCALALAKAGLNPVVIERGSDVDSRTDTVNKYWKEGLLDTETNVQFGEGGAGTFSDGKVLTRISDKLCNYVMSEFVRFGAPDELMYLAKPHIGTDNLRKVVKNIRNEIINFGGKVLFNTKLEHINYTSQGHVNSITLANGESISCSSLFLCIGHSARDTVLNLKRDGLAVEPKPFSVGVRIEHLQKDIDKALYGDFAGAECLGVSQYTLSRKFNNRAVYSFCMCPGGIVVASASDNGQIVTNGMSYYARDGVNANSAIAVSVDTSDYGNTVEGAIEFQENIERKAFCIAGNDGTAPIQLLGDFMLRRAVSEPSRILPTYTGKTVVRNADDVFPSFVTDNLRKGISLFESDIEGFTTSDAVLTFPETRTSSPVRIPRNEQYLALGFDNLYSCGEGAGYAGGITSAAVDGLRAALKFIKS